MWKNYIFQLWNNQYNKLDLLDLVKAFIATNKPKQKLNHTYFKIMFSGETTYLRYYAVFKGNKLIANIGVEK